MCIRDSHYIEERLSGMDVEFLVYMPSVGLRRSSRNVEFVLDKRKASSLCKKQCYLRLSGRKAVLERDIIDA